MYFSSASKHLSHQILEPFEAQPILELHISKNHDIKSLHHDDV